jgi:hypothetical protein
MEKKNTEQITGTVVKTTRKSNLRQPLDLRSKRLAEAMKPQFSPLHADSRFKPNENHKSFGLFVLPLRCKLLSPLMVFSL